MGRWTTACVAAVVAAVMSAGWTACAGSDRIEMRDDFSKYADGSDGRPEWLPLSGVWRIRSGRYVQEEFRFRGAVTFLDKPVLQDVDLSFRFMAKDVGRGVKAAGAVFRSVDSCSFYYAHFDSKNSQVVLVKSARKSDWVPLKRATKTPISVGKWHTARVVCRGARIQVYLDNKLVVEAEDDAYAAGKVGLRCGQGVIEFDDVHVSGTRGQLAKEWRIVKGTAEENDVSARRLERCERVVAVRDDGMFPVLIKLSDGRLAAVVRGGAAHLGEGGRVDVTFSRDGGRSWTKPSVVAAVPPDSRNPAFGQAADGALVVGYAVTGPYEDGKFTGKSREYTVWTVTSTDGGKTWTEPRRLDVSPAAYGSPYGKIVTLKDGTLLMAVYCWGGKEKARVTSRLFRSTDNGRTWGDTSLIAENHNETSLLALPDGRLLAFMRSSGLSLTISTDAGRTWSAPHRVTPPNRHPGDAILLADGKILLTYGHRIVPYGVQCMLSADGGQTWDHDNRVMLEWNAESIDCGYPSSAQLDDGTIVTMYYGVRNSRIRT